MCLLVLYLQVLPPVPKIEIQLEPHHQTLSVGTITVVSLILQIFPRFIFSVSIAKIYAFCLCFIFIYPVDVCTKVSLSFVCGAMRRRM
jgi:hypothetical protein